MSGSRSGRHASPGAYSLEMVDRAVTLLEHVGAASTPAGVSALARDTGIPKTTAYRSLENLARQGLLCRQAGGYVIGARMRKLAALIHDRLPDDVRDLLRPYLVELYTRTGQVVTLGVLDQAEMVILDTVRGLGHAGMAAPAIRSPAHCSAIGKLLMAYRPDLAAGWAAHTVTDWPRLAADLSRIRRQGVAVSLEEHVLGVIDVAMPVVGFHGPVAGVAVSRPAGARTTQRAKAAHRQIILAASAALRARPRREQ